MVNHEATIRPKKRYRVFWFIFRYWFTYGVFGGIAFVAGISLFIPFCYDCRSNYESIRSLIDFILLLMAIIGPGAILGAIVGSIIGAIHAAFIRFWIYYPTTDIQSFRRKVIWSNLLVPTGLMVFSIIFLLPAVFSEFAAILYLPTLAYSIAVIVGLLVSRKFLQWWL